MKDINKNNVYQYFFTVFTPTYNRAYTLHRVYGGLKKQTFHDFEWLIIDDGSTDNTREIVEKWQEKNDFVINYIYQKNQGKHIAFNKAVHNAKGKFFMPLDSDDSCVPEALERFKFHWDNIPEHKKELFTGVTSLTCDQYGKLIGNRFPKDTFDSDLLEMIYKFKMKGDKWPFHKTDILKNFLFTEKLNTKFIPEGIVWSRVGEKYKTRFINEVLLIVWIDKTNQSDQLTRIRDASKHAIGHAYWHETILNYEINWFLFSPKQFFRSAIHYARFSFHAGINSLDQVKKLKNSPAKALWIMMFTIGYLIYFTDNIRRKNL
ncbi:glycosyltransferase family 2 protein [Candidatus Poribacteria bacterium]|nr:glycosyltransferase family 2 protein [Candidatus Poribacteria bacterium]